MTEQNYVDIRITDEAWDAIEEAIANSDADDASQVILGTTELVARLIAHQSKLEERLAAAEKVINLLRDDPTWEQAEAIEAYDKVVKSD